MCMNWIRENADWEKFEETIQKKYEERKKVFDEWCDHNCGTCQKEWCDCPEDPSYIETNLEYDENGAVIVRH